MQTYRNPTQKTQEFKPLDNPERIDVEDTPITLQEIAFNDPALVDFTKKNSFAARQGHLNMAHIHSLRPRTDGRAYGIYYDEHPSEQQDQGDRVDHDSQLDPSQLVGAIFAITKGRDPGTVELAYLLDQDHEGQGIMSASTAALSQKLREERRETTLMFDIDNTNKASARIARNLGAIAWDPTDHGSTLYFATLRRPTAVPSTPAGQGYKEIPRT